MKIEIIKFTVFCLILSITAQAQTTAFNFQGSLTDQGAAANGSYQMQFKMFDSIAGGSQIGATVSDVAVTVANGIFTTRLDFGANAFPGAGRFLEIGVRRNAGESYVTLSPRQQINSSPYAVRAISAQQADLALNANQLGGVAASEYVTNSSVGSSFIRNGATLQTGSFNISGNALIGGLVGLGTPANGNFRLDSLGSLRAFSPASAHFVAETTGGTNTWARFYMRSPSRSWFMGTSQNFNGNQFYLSDETAGQIRMAIATNGFVGFGTSNPQAGLELRGTGALSQQRITDDSSGNSLVLQSGTGGNMKVTGFNYGSGTAVPLYLSVDGANTFLGGNAAQPRGNGGLPKAMLFINFDGSIIRCYNGITGSSSGNCGFSVFNSQFGVYEINFGFQVNDRFLYVTGASNDRVAIWGSECPCPANTLLVNTVNTAGVYANGRFMAILF